MKLLKLVEGDINMRRLNINLNNLSKSEIKYKISQFPDGQQDILLLIKDESYVNLPNGLTKIRINSRLNNFKDLELIICTVKALRRLGVKDISLYIPYLLGARSDRQFQKGGTSYLVDVVAPIINSLGFTSITSIDVHSDVAAACINNFHSESNLELVKYSMSKIGGDNNIIISPDAGSEKKIYNILPQLVFKDLIIAKKHRDILSGNITSTEVPLLPRHIREGRKFFIIDDICDGGRTFIEIAKVLKEKIHSDSRIYLIVTHGIFSAGFKELNKYFNGIYCTNSVKEVGDLDEQATVKTNVTQLNVI